MRINQSTAWLYAGCFMPLTLNSDLATMGPAYAPQTEGSDHKSFLNQPSVFVEKERMQALSWRITTLRQADCKEFGIGGMMQFDQLYQFALRSFFLLLRPEEQSTVEVYHVTVGIFHPSAWAGH